MSLEKRKFIEKELLKRLLEDNNGSGLCWKELCLSFKKASLSTHLNRALDQDYARTFKKIRKEDGRNVNYYQITEKGKERLYQFIYPKKRTILPPPIKILKNKKPRDIIFSILYRNSFCTKKEISQIFTEPNLGKLLNKYILEGYVEKKISKKKGEGSNEIIVLTKEGIKRIEKQILPKYEIDRQTILEQRIKNLKSISKDINRFFDSLISYKIQELQIDDNVKYYFVDYSLKLQYEHVTQVYSDKIYSKRHYYLVLLFFALNNPYSASISFKQFSEIFKFNVHDLKSIIGKFVDSNLFPIKFFKFYGNNRKKIHYFRENSFLDNKLREFVDEQVYKHQIFNGIFKNQISSDRKTIIRDVIDSIFIKKNGMEIGILFPYNLKSAMETFLNETYMEHLITTEFGMEISDESISFDLIKMSYQISNEYFKLMQEASENDIQELKDAIYIITQESNEDIKKDAMLFLDDHLLYEVECFKEDILKFGEIPLKKSGKGETNFINSINTLYKEHIDSPQIVQKYANFIKNMELEENNTRILIAYGEILLKRFDGVLKNKILRILGYLYLSIRVYYTAEARFKEIDVEFKDLCTIVNKNITNLVKSNIDNLNRNMSKFKINYLTALVNNQEFEKSPLDELKPTFIDLIEDDDNHFVEKELIQIFDFILYNIAFHKKIKYVNEVKKIYEIVSDEKIRTVIDVSTIAALCRKVLWITSNEDEQFIEICIQTASLYEQWAEKVKDKPLKKIRYPEILEISAACIKRAGDFQKAGEIYFDIYNYEKQENRIEQSIVMLWMATIQFLKSNDEVKAQELSWLLVNALLKTRRMSVLANKYIMSFLSYMIERNYDQSNDLWENSVRTDEKKRELRKRGAPKAKLIFNQYDACSADKVQDFLLGNDIYCDIKRIYPLTKNKLLEEDGKFDYIILFGSLYAPETGLLSIQLFGHLNGYEKLINQNETWGNVWINQMKSRFILIAGSNIYGTIEATDIFIKNSEKVLSKDVLSVVV